jgi:hypothetical protein
LQARLRVALLRVDEVGELRGIAKEEHRRVVADEIPDPLLGVELEREAARIALAVGRAGLAADGGEAQEQRRLCPPREQLGLGVAGDVPGDGELPNAPEPLACTTRSGCARG